MKILHISNKPVFPKVDGGCVAMASLLQALGNLSDSVYHISINTPKHPVKEELYPKTVTLPLSPAESFIDTDIKIFGALKALITGKNYNLSRFYSPRFSNNLARILEAQDFDVIIFESAFLVNYIPVIREACKAKIVVRTHNTEFLLWEQRAENERFLKRIYLRSLARSLKKEEIAGLNEADEIWSISSADSALLKKEGVTVPVREIPVAVAVHDQLHGYASPDFFHVGSMNWQPNREAVGYLLTELWPAFEQGKSVKLHLGGSFSENLSGAGHSVVNHGFVKDLEAFMRSNGTLLAPLQSGSGIRIKLLEAMALGVPCITTSVGAAGIQHPSKALIVADTKKAWLTAMNDLSSSAELREATGIAGRDYVNKYHSFAAVESKIRESIER